ncbi:MAG TPA: peptidoglycan-binding domain-containing protein [Actinomycetota bacterium]|nr:peptidoglycan-binding domain-containing protein [Actinomycetota bacterium]
MRWPWRWTPTDRDSIRRFQREAGLADDGIIGPRTRGALLA